MYNIHFEHKWVDYASMLMKDMMDVLNKTKITWVKGSIISRRFTPALAYTARFQMIMNNEKLVSHNAKPLTNAMIVNYTVYVS